MPSRFLNNTPGPKKLRGFLYTQVSRVPWMQEQLVRHGCRAVVVPALLAVAVGLLGTYVFGWVVWAVWQNWVALLVFLAGWIRFEKWWAALVLTVVVTPVLLVLSGLLEAVLNSPLALVIGCLLLFASGRKRNKTKEVEHNDKQQR